MFSRVGPITSAGNAPLAGPDAKTAARFPRRCYKRYVSKRLR
jgi:hypothetical protein